ncbi:hypothetical protein RvY_02811 [Ramazzottius varieornatus]|uniref:Uncharacterized protein n=1 Tax=Ramazzottius varieornatus TaxID=947166 RepID=A0A1D1ULS6_RAMVA|nr:hypothetical protein RvY_02811 [Ramazzottius varieornatus]
MRPSTHIRKGRKLDERRGNWKNVEAEEIRVRLISWPFCILQNYPSGRFLTTTTTGCKTHLVALRGLRDVHKMLPEMRGDEEEA